LSPPDTLTMQPIRVPGTKLAEECACIDSWIQRQSRSLVSSCVRVGIATISRQQFSLSLSLSLSLCVCVCTADYAPTDARPVSACTMSYPCTRHFRPPPRRHLSLLLSVCRSCSIVSREGATCRLVSGACLRLVEASIITGVRRPFHAR